MSDATLRPMTDADEAEVLAINAAAVHQTGPMDAALLRHQRVLSAEHRVVERDGRLVAILTALCGGCGYEGENFRWFDARFRGFFYIDRIVVAEPARGAGLGHLVYEHAIARARELQLHWLAAEVNRQPPNPVSLAFHEGHGFREVGVREVEPGKLVSLQVRTLSDR